VNDHCPEGLISNGDRMALFFPYKAIVVPSPIATAGSIKSALAWTAGLRTQVDTWGPPPLEKMTRLFFEMNDYYIETRIADEGRVPLAPLVQVHESSSAGEVMRDETLKVTSALVHHLPVVPAFGYCFDAADRSIVISGDTSPSDDLVRLAEGADVLVHDTMYLPGIDRLAARVPNA
jgi:ribonuclease BN (tRNA processing enzyme)